MTDGGEDPEEGRSEEPEPPGAAAEAPTEDGEEPGDANPGESTAEEGGPASTDLGSADPETASPTSGNPDSAGSGVTAPGSTTGDRTETTPAEGSGRSDGAEDEVAGSVEPVEEGASGEDADQNGSGSEESATDGQDAGPVADSDGQDAGPVAESAVPNPEDVPPDVRKYDRFKKIDGSTYDRANEFLRDRTYITAREWAIARLCADFRTETGVEMTKIGEHLPQLVPFMTDTYSPQAVNQARHAFEEKVRKAGATFLYGAMCDFFTAEELDDVMYEATEVAKFLLEVEGVDLAVEEELAAEDRISSVMREVRESSAALRHDEVRCPECGHSFEASEGAHEAESAEGGGD